MAFGKSLKNFLDQRNVSVAEAAKRSGVAYTTLDSIIKRDSSNISMSVARKIASAFGVSTDEIEGLAGVVPQTEKEAEILLNEKLKNLTADMSLLDPEELEQIESMIQFFAKRRAGQAGQK